MKILVDTSVWSLSLRKKTKNNEEILIVKELEELIKEARVVFIGPIRQEILSGISDDKKFKMLTDTLRAFEDKELFTKHYEKAAEMMNICRKNGVQGSHIDFLICAVAVVEDYFIFTLDNDFFNYSKYLDIKLYEGKSIK